MNIHEHQAKKILKEFGAPVSDGVVIFSIDEIRNKISELKSYNAFLISLVVFEKRYTKTQS
jgi:succinyl-CoA synthetase beta subunit